MSDDQLLREAMEIFANSLQGGPVQRMPSGGRYGPKLGGRAQTTSMFRPVSADEQLDAAFRQEHEHGMRGEVLNSVLHTLTVWHSPDAREHQVDFDAVFVALAHLGRFLRAQVPNPLTRRLLERCLVRQDSMASAWLQPLISAKLNAPDA